MKNECLCNSPSYQRSPKHESPPRKQREAKTGESNESSLLPDHKRRLVVSHWTQHPKTEDSNDSPLLQPLWVTTRGQALEGYFCRFEKQQAASIGDDSSPSTNDYIFCFILVELQLLLSFSINSGSYILLSSSLAFNFRILPLALEVPLHVKTSLLYFLHCNLYFIHVSISKYSYFAL